MTNYCAHTDLSIASFIACTPNAPRPVRPFDHSPPPGTPPTTSAAAHRQPSTSSDWH